MIMGELESIRRLFVNLINNGIEAMEGKGKLEISLEHDTENVVVGITDHGSGIDDKDMKNLFVPFFTTKERGTGLGLSIVKKIVEEHKGNIEVTSKKGSGTTFHVVLPCKKPKGDV
jgi:signal transduction histidine kinase